jgi:hypothetical protein
MPALKKKAGPKRKASLRQAGLRQKLKALKKVVARKKSGAAVKEKGPTTAENLEERFDLTRGGMRYPK